MQQILLSPLLGELPSHYAERLSKFYGSKTKQEHKKELGQFFTPLRLSNFIASFSSFHKNKVTILDPGCGTCILSCSLIEKLSENKKLKTIELTTYEIDQKLNFHTVSLLRYLNDWLSKKKIAFITNHKNVDFINENFSAINFLSKKRFDIIISNPPYFKISKEDERKKLFQRQKFLLLLLLLLLLQRKRLLQNLLPLMKMMKMKQQQWFNQRRRVLLSSVTRRLLFQLQLSRNQHQLFNNSRMMMKLMMMMMKKMTQISTRLKQPIQMMKTKWV